MNAKDFQDLLKESKDILQEGSGPARDRYLNREYLGKGNDEEFDPKKELTKIKAEEEEENRIADKIAAAKKRQKEYDRIGQEHDEEFYTRYDKKSLIEIIRKKLEEAGEIIDDPSIIMDKLARFIDDIKTPKSSALKDYQNQKRP